VPAVTGNATLESGASAVRACAADPVTAGTYYAVSCQGAVTWAGAPYPLGNLFTSQSATSMRFRSVAGGGNYATKRTFTGSGLFTDVRAIVFGGRIVLAIGSQAPGDSMLTSTADGGTTWSDTNIAPIGQGINFWRMAASPTLLMAAPWAQENPQLMGLYTSADGISWTTHAVSFAGAQDAIRGVAYDAVRGLFVVAVQTAQNASPASSAFFTSPDGVLWTEVGTGPSGVSVSDIGVVGSCWVCTALDAGDAQGSQLMFSADGGATWRMVQAGFLSNVSSGSHGWYYAPPQLAVQGGPGLLAFNGAGFRFSKMPGLPAAL
jgi:hypothetical protein